MDAVELLRTCSGLAFDEVKEAIEGVQEAQAWSALPNLGPDYLHSDASIHGITLHIASCKFVYGSVGFRNTEIRWRDVADRLDSFEPSWPAAVAYLEESQQYWMESWASLTSADLEKEVPRFRGELWPAWKIIRVVMHHDSYHAGQIAMLRYGIGDTESPPPSVAEDIRKYCSDLPSW